jgi:hypothetical protein
MAIGGMGNGIKWSRVEILSLMFWLRIMRRYPFAAAVMS